MAAYRSYDREGKPVGNHPDCVRDLCLWAGFILRIQLSESHDGEYCLCDGILPTTCVVRGYRLLVFERMRAVPGQAEYIPRLGFSLQDALTLRAAYPSPALPPPLPRIKAFALCVSAKERVQGSGRGRRHIQRDRHPLLY